MPEKINLVLSRASVFVWSAEDWLKLRRDHRIVGELVGCLSKQPRQEVLSGLPVMLLPEEVTLLLERNIAQVITYPCLQKPSSEIFAQTFKAYREMLFIEQEQCLIQERKKQILLKMDDIIEGKKRKQLGIDTKKKNAKKPLEPKVQEALNSIVINKEDLLKEEMEKLPKLVKAEALIQTHTMYPWLNKEVKKIVEWNYPSTDKEKLRYRTYKDLWEKGYYVTTGEKFGGDFLAYPGDPIMFHSQFIVDCKERNEKISVLELISQCRVSCQVRKTRTYAMFAEDQDVIEYQSCEWADTRR